MTIENTEKIKENIINILKGIDCTETDSAIGWWETSSDAEFGAEKLIEIIKVLEGKDDNRNS